MSGQGAGQPVMRGFLRALTGCVLTERAGSYLRRVGLCPSRTAPSLAALTLASLPLTWASPAEAHPSPALAPQFPTRGCITVVDKVTAGTWTLEYGVPYDETTFDEDDLVLEDGKSHEFYAVQGQVVPSEQDLVLVSPTDPEAGPLSLPLWIEQQDLTRAEVAAAAVPLTDFVATDVDPSDVLELREDLKGRFIPLQNPAVRVPITRLQASMGVSWDLTQVAVGSYQVLGYVFSPPYNAWAVRPGLVKVEEDGQGPPAVTVQAVNARVFAGQGRRISGCAVAPPASTLEVLVRSTAADAWEVWYGPEPVAADGDFEYCLMNPGLDGQLQVRVDVISPAGVRVSARPGDQMTFFAAPAACEPTSILCCDDGSSQEASQEASHEASQESGQNPDRGASASAGANLEDAKPEAANPNVSGSGTAGAVAAGGQRAGMSADSPTSVGGEGGSSGALTSGASDMQSLPLGSGAEATDSSAASGGCQVAVSAGAASQAGCGALWLGAAAVLCRGFRLGQRQYRRQRRRQCRRGRNSGLGSGAQGLS